MGTDKALLRIGHRTILERVIARVAEVAEEVMVIGREGLNLPGVRAVPDVRPGAGALGGIYTALLAARNPHCLIVGCDMPFLKPELLRYLIGLSAEHDVTIPRLGHLLEPLHAVYARTCLGPIEQLLDHGGLRILDFFPDANVRYVDREDMEALGPIDLSFFNVNTPEGLRRAMAIAAETEREGQI